ncbi:MAG TPA: CAP domain-containing protein [Sphingomonadaceae bacterium]|nr:CAP domain-containing protein [Sphingomonadaceae bacterium]
MIKAMIPLGLGLALLACLPAAQGQTSTSVRSASDPAPDRLDLAARLLAKHNDERVGEGLPRLVWNAGLAQGAAEWARTIARDGNMRHSPKSSRPEQGENLWMGTADFYSIEHMMDRFLDEKRDFRPGIFPDISKTGEWQDVAHYTQIIWPETREMGCALASANGRDALVCRYLPAGNVRGRPVGL